jgi:hypothetical protein
MIESDLLYEVSGICLFDGTDRFEKNLLHLGTSKFTDYINNK